MSRLAVLRSLAIFVALFVTVTFSLHTRPAQSYDPGLHKVSGEVLDEHGDGIADVTIVATRIRAYPGAMVPQTTTALTDEEGKYVFINLPAGDYTIAPSHDEHGFNPSVRTIPLNRDFVDQDFTAIPPPYKVEGRITDSDGAGIADITVVASQLIAYPGPDGPLVITTTTKPDGTYVVDDLVLGSYTLTPTHPDYDLTPIQRTIRVNGNLIDQDFTATQPPYQAGGRMTDHTGRGLAGMEVVLSQLSPYPEPGASLLMTVTTDLDGTYSFDELPRGNYLITPVHRDYRFSPLNWKINLRGDLDNRNFVAYLIHHRVSGQVTDSLGDGVAQLEVVAVERPAYPGPDDPVTITTFTDHHGHYTFTDVLVGNYTITPDHEHYTFSPESREISINIGQHLSGQDFTATLIPYQVSGNVADNDGYGIANVTLIASQVFTYPVSSDPFTLTTLTDDDGNYTLSDLTVGTYTLTPAHDSYAFTPISRTISVTEDLHDQDFAATLLTFQVSGRVAEANGTGVAGVTISDGTRSTTTDAQGAYALADVPVGHHTLTATHTLYSFSPATLAISVTDDLEDQDFTARLLQYTVSGRVAEANGTGVAGVTISDGTRSTTTDAEGAYALADVPTGHYTLTATHTLYSFNPATLAISVTDDLADQDFIATLLTYDVSGRVAEANGAGVAGVTISDGTRSTTTDAQGTYTLSDLPIGSYTLVVSHTDYSFAPTSRTISVTTNLSGQDFTATLLTYSVSGRITDPDGVGVADVMLSDGIRNVFTDIQGNYTLADVPVGSYTLTPERSGYTFTPNQRQLTVREDLIEQDFIAVLSDPGDGAFLRSITPNEATNTQATQVTIRGNGFSANTAPSAQLSSQAGLIDLTNITPENRTSFKATVPAGLAPGRYDLLVTSNGRTGLLANAFIVLGTTPEIEQVMPTSAFNDQPAEVLIEGLNFAEDVRVQLGTLPLTTTRVNGTLLFVEVPAGLEPATYDLVVRNPDGSQARLRNAFSVLDPTDELNDDLFSSRDQLWLNPLTPRINTSVELGLLVQRQGGKQVLENVPVAFHRDSPTGPLLGTAMVPFLDPRSTESTLPLEVRFANPGLVTIYAIIDPEHTIPEIDTNNNVVQRTFLVAPAGLDRIPPVVERIRVNDGTSSTVVNRDLTLGIHASDPQPGSGVSHLHVIEYLYNESAKRWVPVIQSGWMAFSQNPERYHWSLLPKPGMRYLQVRARDGAGNISIGNARQLINYEAPRDRIARGQTRIYRYHVEEGQAFQVNLEVLSGDADLYVWSSRADQSAWVSNLSGSADEQVIISANEVVPGIYQVEVYGYSAAEYRLSTSFDLATANLASGGLDESKDAPSKPVLPVASIPDERAGTTPLFELDLTSIYTVYLPLTVR
ncbi:MSCRAMM family protein [Candidatus Viridilinea mediisalina]|uniref:IPT/TIG domain-containing protein n=1 Tax=Candidatus Viridilinea mediisalina TaxID=2024553 RepID=A0A2A6RNM0_9CHLR|nr:carboxypeptidase-like regulatory domain-containing protein [Candidatus Viridilinea mediisalina]PDW04704.1 hypothetical protein CJ255_02065 [Candidatus Viridilinea mediisalina]